LRLHGTARPKPMGGVRRAVLRDHRAWLLARLAAEPDVTLRGLQAELRERGVVVSHWAIWKLFDDEGISFKKKHSAVRATSSGHRQSPALVAMAPDTG
jgi:transposase